MKTREKEYDYLDKGNKLVDKLVYEFSNGKKYSNIELIDYIEQLLSKIERLNQNKDDE